MIMITLMSIPPARSIITITELNPLRRKSMRLNKIGRDNGQTGPRLRD
jgi:hypothetical protein